MKGRCYCGALKYEVTAAPVWKLQCHCRECQYISGGGPNFAMAVPLDGFAFVEGTPAKFKRDDIEGARTRQFCGTCGTHILTLLPGRDYLVLKAGTLDDPAADYGDADFAIFMKDAQPFHVVAEGKPCFHDLPPQ
jgi:hypothetical protein